MRTLDLTTLLAGFALLTGCAVSEPPAPTTAEVEQDLVVDDAADVEEDETDDADQPEVDGAIGYLPVEVEGLRLPGAEQQRTGGPQGGPEPDPWRGENRPEGGPEPDPWDPWLFAVHASSGSGKKD